MSAEILARVELVERDCRESVENLGVRFDHVEAAIRGDGVSHLGILARLATVETNLTTALEAQKRLLWGVAAGIGTLLTFVAVEIVRSYMHSGVPGP